ncbi:uncharacterized protein N7503_011660 [Penicillium pulvis]|uniref:uncharacterized protein n=1 Tax=Penicillium pulvis TaxID=1562058 RepID=UPI002546AE83|nr:uncharacterized protein N7503_011660 [Penicillium pulvis]KAJ5786448.1 hypothetical protein N7503_011660 [Penicillium pulvis]
MYTLRSVPDRTKNPQKVTQISPRQVAPENHRHENTVNKASPAPCATSRPDRCEISLQGNNPTPKYGQ